MRQEQRVVKAVLQRSGVLLAIGTFTLAAAAAEDRPTPRACPPDKVWDEAANGCLCGPGTNWDDAVRKCVVGCPTGKVQVEGAKPGTCIHAVQPRCPVGENWSDAHGKCVPACPKSNVVDPKGIGCVEPGAGEQAPPPPPAPPPAAPPPPRAEPKEPKERACPAGKQRQGGSCVPVCPAGRVLDPTGRICVAASKTTCPEGREWKDAFDACVPICPPGQVLDFYGTSCHSIKNERRRN